MTTTTELIKSYCRSCCNDNNHKVLFKEKINSNSEEYHCATEYSTIQCLGCEAVSFREDFHDYEQSYPNEHDDWEHTIIITTYPPYLKDHRQLDGYWKLPEAIKAVYIESVNAFKADWRLLAGAGFRAVIEAICIDKDIKGKNLEIKINNLAKGGLITKQECERLHSIRFLGNDSIHEMKVPENKQLKVVLSIVEHILKNLYLIDFEIGKTLDTTINTFPAFKRLLNDKLEGFKIGDQFPLVKFLGKDVRRVKENFMEFETQLMGELNNDTYKPLKIGEVIPYGGSTAKVQHYMVHEIPGEF